LSKKLATLLLSATIAGERLRKKPQLGAIRDERRQKKLEFATYPDSARTTPMNPYLVLLRVGFT